MVARRTAMQTVRASAATFRGAGMGCVCGRATCCAHGAPPVVALRVFTDRWWCRRPSHRNRGGDSRATAHDTDAPRADTVSRGAGALARRCRLVHVRSDAALRRGPSRRHPAVGGAGRSTIVARAASCARGAPVAAARVARGAVFRARISRSAPPPCGVGRLSLTRVAAANVARVSCAGLRSGGHIAAERIFVRPASRCTAHELIAQFTESC